MTSRHTWRFTYFESRCEKHDVCRLRDVSGVYAVVVGDGRSVVLLECCQVVDHDALWYAQSAQQLSTLAQCIINAIISNDRHWLERRSPK